MTTINTTTTPLLSVESFGKSITFARNKELDKSNSVLKNIADISAIGLGLTTLVMIADYSINVWNWSQSPEKEWYPLFGKTLGGPLVLPTVYTEPLKSIAFAVSGMTLGTISGYCKDVIQLNKNSKSPAA